MHRHTQYFCVRSSSSRQRRIISGVGDAVHRQCRRQAGVHCLGCLAWKNLNYPLLPPGGLPSNITRDLNDYGWYFLIVVGVDSVGRNRVS